MFFRSTSSLYKFPSLPHKYDFLFIGKLHTHLASFEPMTSPSTLLLQREKVPFELELIGKSLITSSMKPHKYELLSVCSTIKLHYKHKLHYTSSCHFSKLCLSLYSQTIYPKEILQQNSQRVENQLYATK